MEDLVEEQKKDIIKNTIEEIFQSYVDSGKFKINQGSDKNVYTKACFLIMHDNKIRRIGIFDTNSEEYSSYNKLIEIIKEQIEDIRQWVNK